METGFTIDDVRETLTRDVTRSLGRIERAAREILDDRALAIASHGSAGARSTPGGSAESIDGEPPSLLRLVAIGEQSHAIYGTSRLVAAQSLADSSARMETLAQHGREQLARALRHLTMVRDIAAAMVGGSTDMLEMLSLELDGKPREAQTIAESWRLRVDDVLQGSSIIVAGAESANSNLRVVGRPTVDLHGRRSSAARAVDAELDPVPEALDHGWSEIDDGPRSPVMPHVMATPVPPSGAGGYSFASSIVEPEDDTSVIDADLAEVFAEEASSTLTMLDGALAALRTSLDDRSLLKSIERGFHTLKGAAATVGLAQVSAHAAELQDRAELLADEDRPVMADEAEALIRDAATLRRLAGIPAPAPLFEDEPSLDVAPPAAPPAELSRGFDEVVAEFERDARVTLDEAEHLMRDLRDADPASALLLVRDLASVMHRLRGSALVAGFDPLAEIAAGIEAILEASPIHTDKLAQELGRAGALLAGRPAAPRAPTPSEPEMQRVVVPVPDAEIDPSFQQECADLLEALDRAALALERSERPADHIGDLLRNYHTLKGVVNALGLWPIGDQLHKLEDLLESLTASSVLPPLRAITAVLLPFHGELRRQLRTVTEGYVDVVPGRLESRFARMSSIASRQTSASSIAPSSPPRSRGSRLGEGSEVSEVAAASAPDRRNLRVSIDRLDALMNLAGELVINRSRLLSRIDWLRGLQTDLGRSARHVVELVEKFRDDHEFSMLASAGTKDRGTRWQGFSDLELDRYEDVNILARTLNEGSTDLYELFAQFAGGLGALADDSDSLGTIISGIQGEVTRTRMVPLEVLFSRLELPMRDAAEREGRDVRMETTGADVHLDKTIVDSLFQPMLHIVRNAVSHGIEAPGVRTAAGKPAHGTVTLRARQELGQVVVEIIDDGAGLDLERLRERGAALGLVDHDTPLDDPRIRDLIFVHGLSTQVAADAVAGRGVGCDVVRRAIDRLNGSIRVESVRHERTVFAITLPVTLAISRALLVRHAGETFAVPLYFTERIIDAHEVEIVESANQRRIDIDGAYLSVRPLGDFVSGPTAADGPILLLQVGDQRLVVQVDEVLTQEQIVVKNLGPLLRGHPAFAGVTIRGTGETVLILDIPSITDTALGRGAVVRTAQRARKPVEPALPEPAPEPVDLDRPLRVLFVDDSVSVRKVAERALKMLGVEVTLATDGVDALDKLRGGQFDLVFTDLEMPRMHGYELIRELRFLPAYRAMPVVVVTSRSGKKHRDEAQALGASEYITKPFTQRSLAVALVKFAGPRAGVLALEAAGGEVLS